MAESRFAAIGPQSPITRAEVNLPAFDPDAVARTFKDDGTTYHALTPPGFFDSGPNPGEAGTPPILSEDEKRDRLRTALAAQTVAEQVLASAERTYARAREHLQRCQDAVQAFATIDEDAAAETIAQLTDPDRARVELPAAMQARLTARDLAHAECVAAESANAQLIRKLATAKEAATHAARAARTATVALLGIDVARLAIEFREVEAEQDDRFERLAQFDRFAAGTGIALPAHVMGVLTAEPKDRRGRIRSVLDTSEWRGLAEKLQAEVQTESVEESVDA